MAIEVIDDLQIISTLDNIGIVQGVDSGLEQQLKTLGYNTIPLASSEDPGKLGKIADGSVEAIICRTNINLLSPDFYQDHRVAHLLVGACRDPRFGLDSAREHGVWTLRVNANTDAVAHRTISVFNNICYGTARGTLLNRSGKWGKKEATREMINPRDQVIGIVGFGVIGQKFAKHALSQGNSIVIYNDGPQDKSREHDKEIKDKLKDLEPLARMNQATITVVNSVDELVETANVLSIHANSQNYEGKENDGIVSLEQIKKLHKDSKRPGMLLSTSRLKFIAAKDEEIDGLLENRELHSYFTDVHNPADEHEGNFNFNFNSSEAYGTPHIFGSGAWIEQESSRQILEDLIPSWEAGRFARGMNPAYLRHELEAVHFQEGDLVFSVMQSTRSGAEGTLRDLIRNLKIGVTDFQQVRDKRAGTNISFPVVPRTYVLSSNGNGTEINEKNYAETIRALVAGIIEINKMHPRDVRSVRPIPTNKAQRKFLHSPGTRLSPNLAAA